MERIRQNIEMLVANEYKAYGFVGQATVRVPSENEIVLALNHENPFMGEKFWEFVGTLHDKIVELGYEKKDGTFFFDFYILTYVK